MRPIIMMLGLAMLLVNMGDCVNLAFADSKAAECCLMADCPFANAPQADNCCKNPVSPSKYTQAGSQKSLSQPAVKYIDFPTEIFAMPVVEVASLFSDDLNLHAPPGGLNGLSTPLLI